MAVYLIGAVDIQDDSVYAVYRERVAATLAPFEGIEVLSTDDHPIILEGAQPANHLFLIKFSSHEQLQAFYHSEAYQGIITYRHTSSEARFLMVMRSAQSAHRKIA